MSTDLKAGDICTLKDATALHLVWQEDGPPVLVERGTRVKVIRTRMSMGGDVAVALILQVLGGNHNNQFVVLPASVLQVLEKAGSASA